MAGQFTPEYIYNLVASNPQLRGLVENLAKANELQQQVQQYAPQIQQFAQNPMQALNSAGNWAQGATNYMQQQQQAQDPSQQTNVAQQPQQEVQPMTNGNGGIMGMAMDIVNKFDANFGRIEEQLKSISEENVGLKDKISKLNDDISGLSKSNAKLTDELSAARKDIGQLGKSTAK